MFRYIAWTFAAFYLLIVGLVPAALAPVTLAFAGLATVVAAVPPPVLLLVAAVVWLKRKPAPAKPATA
ncbi:hypothetical protein ACIPMW_32370 [Streptomyces sp. NPDC086669]|uniref:hypothetical protein n=1 Tax=Streptomyces sp. NPDC086669 TaxID=3365753 RepID=UPI00382700C8